MQHCVNTNFSSMQICKIEAFCIGQLSKTLKTKRKKESETKSLQWHILCFRERKIRSD